MIALIQRVSEARVEIGGEVVARIGPGLLALVCAERDDSESQTERLLERVLNYRVFADEAGKMNRSLRDQCGDLLLVPQFTLAADTRSGNRPSFTPAAAPEQGRLLFEFFATSAARAYADLAPGVLALGRFGADMRVHLCNEGPVTFWLRVPPVN